MEMLSEEFQMRFNPGVGRGTRALLFGVCLVTAVGCGQTSAEPSASAQAPSSSAGCEIPFPDGIPVPDGLDIETCNQAKDLTGFHGKAPLPKNVDASYAALKGEYEAGGYTLYDQTNGKIRSLIFGGEGHRKGQIQLNPKEGYLSVSINLYPSDMED
jgi:hypothetical protein|tara:strand:- start:40630 stop:41100 length:471 start_codon:yes stop_codon:yes gene_type:complete